MNVSQFFEEYSSKVRNWLQGVVNKEDNILREAMGYTLFSSGKMLRPVLTGAVCCAYGGDENRAIIPSGCVEMIHTYSLIHDDLPCMDNDDTRRGVPSSHVVYGEALALLAGDALLTQAFESLTSEEACKELGYVLTSKLVFELASAAGASGMVYGQALDMQEDEGNRREEFVSDMQSLKTGKLITAACRMGALVAGAGDDELSQITEYAQNLGLLFQITDDILDAIGDSGIVGKPLKKDAVQGKTTFVTLYGVDEARKVANIYAEKALSKVKNLGPHNILVEIVNMMRTRNR